MLEKLTKTGLICGGTGLLGILVLILSGAAYPDTLFRALAPLSLLLIFAALPPLGAAWLLNIRKEWGADRRTLAVFWVAVGLLLFLRQLCRFL